jgi:uncharacterized protein YifE (UPF0438 family)
MRKTEWLEKEHKEFLSKKGQFKIDCQTHIFNNDEIEILKKYGHWFKALTDGTLVPFTDKQRQFIQVARGIQEPFSPEEWAWFKYLGRKRVEQEYPDLPYLNYIPDSDSFYNREMSKQVKSTIFKVIRESHRE